MSVPAVGIEAGNMNCAIRDYIPSDLLPVAEVYLQSIRQLARGVYTPRQIAAWSAPGEDSAASQRSLALFEHQGFRVRHRDVTTVKGVAFTRYAMIPERGNPA